MKPYGPQRIVCMTEEGVETLYRLGEDIRIVGHSSYVTRPVEVVARKLPIVSAFTGANLKKITALQPDLVLGYSDIQKDIAAKLIGAGIDVWIANHRTLDGIMTYIQMLGGMVGRQHEADELVKDYQQFLDHTRRQAVHIKNRPRVYFEEWDDPAISAIPWVSGAITAAGGDDIFLDLHADETAASVSLARDRVVKYDEVVARQPDIILLCWCGKPADIAAVKARPGWESIPAVKNNRVIELDPAIFLQPGPALLTDGLARLHEIFNDFTK